MRNEEKRNSTAHNEKSRFERQIREEERRLKEFERMGLQLFIDDENATPGEIARKLVRESGNYMADYVEGEDHRLVAIRYDWIAPQSRKRRKKKKPEGKDSDIHKRE